MLMAPAEGRAEREATPDLAAKVRFLGSAAAHGGRTDVEAIETHMSWVFLAGERVLKLKKPVRFPMLDFTSLAAREHCCREEVRLNARLAPGVYLGLEALQWDGSRFTCVDEARSPDAAFTVDWLVSMRRLPEKRTLRALVARRSAAPADIDALLAVLVVFYRRAAAVRVCAEAYAAGFDRELAADREVLLRPQFRIEHAAVALERLDTALRRHAGLLARRCAHRRIVDGHGDLRPEHVFMLEPPVVIDCIEFNAQLRQVDPFDEIAFLGFECGLLGAAWIGRRLADGLAVALDDRPPPALLHLYTAHRALLRARLAIAHLLDPQPRTAQRWAPLAQRCVGAALDALDALEQEDVLLAALPAPAS
ncbi:MAG TPA: hypothetical protein VMU47_00455 [Caldimonas sp.]|nr:hypothetical protein [Caldimonas sp.]